MFAQRLMNQLKPHTRWLVLAITSAFLLHTLRQNWQQVLTLRFTDGAIAFLILAVGITLLSHIWSAWIWHIILTLLAAPIQRTWVMVLYLQSNLAKYLPGNVWHFVNRIQALRSHNISTGTAIVGVLLEPLLMSAAALAIVFLSLPSTGLQLAILIAVLVGVHPRVLNPVLHRLAPARLKQVGLSVEDSAIPQLKAYPLKPFLGEVGFVVLRGCGFLFSLSALESWDIGDFWRLMGSFSLAWLLGLVVPGAPGGLGVFEATILALLGTHYSAATLLGSVTLYRLVGTLAEILGAALAWVDLQINTWLARPRIPSQPESVPLALPPSAPYSEPETDDLPPLPPDLESPDLWG